MIMPSKSIKVSIGGVISFIVLTIAYLYKHIGDDSLRMRVDLTHDSLIAIEKKVSVNPHKKVAVGYGSCLDVIVQSRDVILDYMIPPDEVKHHQSIATPEELTQVFAYFFQYGAAAERYISNSSLFNSLIELANKAERAMKSLGGNAPVMANRFAKEGIGEVLLGAQMSNELKNLLSSDITVSGPTIKSDDIHLLLEYPTGESWGNYVAPRANRFIVHNDDQNPLLSSMEDFHRQLLDFKADLLVIGGLHMMDNVPFSYEIRKSRIVKLSQYLLHLRQSNKIKIHFEMASFTDPNLMNDIVTDILPHVDSLGMNEQELPNLFNILAFGNISLISDAYPRVATILDQTRDLYDYLYTYTKGKLSRIHVHTLAFQTILTRKDSPWKHSLTAAAKAALTAHRHTCGSDVIDTEKAKLIMDESFTTSRNERKKERIPFDAKNPVACWEEASSWNRHAISICIAPVLVCTRVLQTGGGGDNISAAGLVLQI